VERRLAHKALIPPLATFSDTSFGTPRFYRIEPDLGAMTRAAELDIPQAVFDVLRWGSLLARGLSELHEQNAVLTHVDLANVLIDGAAASWVCFGDNVHFIDAESDDVKHLRTENVRELAGALVKLVTGSDTAQVARRLQSTAGRVLGQVMTANGNLRADDFAVALERGFEDLVRTRPVSYAVGARTDVGRVRKLNEDSMLAIDYSSSSSGGAVALGLFAVADGVGGNAAGDVASRLTVESLQASGESLKNAASAGRLPEAEAWLVEAARAANESVYEERQAASSDMGSTLVLALLIGGAATVLNVGDSRAYRLHRSGIDQVTTDHSLVQRLVSIGQLTPEEARRHPQKSVIYRVIGDTLDLPFDVFDVTLAPGDALLLCSDGLSDLVEDPTLWKVWNGAVSPQAACDKLVELAAGAGGHDNITVVIAQIEV
jgi:protein phosphatase